VDGGPKHRLTLLLGAIGNGRFFGGGMKICPDARLDDGQLDLVTVGNLGRLEVLAKIHRIYSGTHLAMKEVKHTHCHFVDVTPCNSTVKIPVEIDGETPGMLPARFEVLKKALPLRL
jgi:diacylglycerol kinase family enzyme